MIDEPVRAYAPHEAGAIVRSVAAAGGSLDDAIYWLEGGYSLAAVRGNLRALAGQSSGTARSEAALREECRTLAASFARPAAADPWEEALAANNERLAEFQRRR